MQGGCTCVFCLSAKSKRFCVNLPFFVNFLIKRAFIVVVNILCASFEQITLKMMIFFGAIVFYEKVVTF